MSDLFFTVHLHRFIHIMFIILFRCKANLAFHKSNILLHKQHGHPFEQLQPPFFFFFYSNTGFNPSLRFRILIALSSGAFSWEQWKIWLGLLAYLLGQTLLQKSKALEVPAHALLKSITNVGQ